MKHIKKWLALGLSVAMVLCLLCANLTVTAGSTDTWMDFDAKQVANGLDWSGGDGVVDCWSIDEATPYRLANWQNWGYIYGSTYANIRKLTVPQSGVVSFETIWGTGVYTDDAESFEFAILDKNKKIIWPTNGTPAFLKGAAGAPAGYGAANGNYFDESLSLTVNDVKAGDEFYFVFMNGSSQPTNFAATMVIKNNSTRLDGNGSGFLCGDDFTKNGSTTAGGAQWDLMYASKVTLTNADPNADTNMGGGDYTVDYGTLTEMHKISQANGDPNNGWLGNGNYNNVPFAAGMAIYFGNKKDAHVTRFTPSSDGNFKIGYAGIQLRASQGHKWEDGTGVDFCIVDHTGKVVYPENGGVIELRAGTENPFDRAGAVAFYHSNLKAGEWLDFVLIPRGENLAANYGKYVYMAGSFNHPSATLSGNRIDSSGRLFLSHGENQGDRQVKMFTASGISVNKVAEGEWKEFVKLGSALEAAPATAEVQVKVPENVPDWQAGTIISDMNGTTGNGFAVMMDTFGNPRFISGGFDWTVKNVDLRTGAWTRLTFTADTTAGKAYCYINGAQVAETDINASLAVSGKAPVIGNDLSLGFTTAFEGSMKKLALANTARSAAQVETEMTAAESAHYWVLNGVYTDKAGSNHGVLTQVNSNWYENGKPADAADGEYTIVHVGDNQVVTDFIDDGYQEVTKWIAANAERLNIQMVINTGDLVNYAATTGQWDDAVAGMNILMENGIPYVYATGNHEYPSSGTNVPRTSAEFNKYFDIADHMVQGAGKSNETKLIYAYPNTNKLTGLESLTPKAEGSTSYGKNYEETLENGVYFATIGGKPYAFIALEAQPRKTVIAWANTVLTALEAEYDNLVTYVNTHIYLESNGTIPTSNSAFDAAERKLDYTPAEVYDLFLSQHKSIQLVLSGHVATGIATRTDVGVNGNKIVSIMNDQSYEGNGGEGNVLLLRCREDGTVIKAEYYSTILERYYMQAYQFDFDTAADSDVAFSLPTISNMEKSNNSDRWYVSNNIVGTMQGGALVGGTLLAAYRDYAGVRTFVPAVSGTVSYKFEITALGAGSASVLEMALCKDDGTILWPTNGSWHTVSAKITDTVTFKATAGEKVHLILRAINPANVTAQKYIQVKSTVTVTDAAGVSKTYTSNSGSTGLSYATQGTNGWYADWIRSASQIKVVAPTYTVNYGVDGEGGTLSASTSGQAATGKCIVPSGGTVVFTANPKVGYRIVGYYVNGVYYRQTRRKLTLPMIKENLNVVVKFVKDKVEGDANGDGVLNILDMVNMNNGIADEAAFTDKTVCDLVDDIAAVNGADQIDAKDVKELRRRILG